MSHVYSRFLRTCYDDGKGEGWGESDIIARCSTNMSTNDDLSESEDVFGANNANSWRTDSNFPSTREPFAGNVYVKV